MSYELIKVEKKGHLTIITINRPDVMNAASLASGPTVALNLMRKAYWPEHG